MCGILFSNIRTINKISFDAALELMDHRGPDATGYFSQHGIQMGHKRLKIQDLDSRSNQPFHSSCGTYICIFNGEIYNFKELAQSHSIETKTTSDTEVLIELYAMYGEKMLPMLNGMFAFLILDTRDGSYFVARDRLGIKPLYVYSSSQGVVVSSEVAPILGLISKVELDEVGIRQYRKLRSFFNDRTLYKNVSMFPAAQFLYSNSLFDRKKCKKYWEIDFSFDSEVEDEEVESLLISAVNFRNLSDVPVGTYLSGGLDSTIITSLASQTDSWTVGFHDHNEYEYAGLAAGYSGTTHHEVDVAYKDFIPTMESIIRKRMEPLSVPNEVLLYLMTKQVRTKNTVVLSGEGADELFFGYDRIFWWASNNSWSVESFDKYYSYGTNPDLEIIEDVMDGYSHYQSALEKTSAFFQINHLHGLLRRLDNSTMLNSVEGRVPFVDHRLVELMASASFDYRTGLGSNVKAPLKRIFKDKIIESAITRKKIGFPVPIDKIFVNQGNDKKQPMDLWLDYNMDYLINKVLT